MATPFRIEIEENDRSAFANLVVDETGLMVVDSFMGPEYPIKCQNEQDYQLYFGLPNASKWHGFEAISYVRQAPLWVARALGSNFKYAGIDVLYGQSSAVAFGTRTGRDYTTFNPTTTNRNAIQTVIASADGITALYSGTLTNVPIVGGSYQLKVGGVLKASVEASGIITGADATGTLNLTSGAYAITFAGTPGTVASYTTLIDFSSPIDLSSGSKNKAINITIDGTLFENIDLGNSTTTARTDVITAINAALGYTSASISGNFIQIVGLLGSATLGEVTISDPTDLITYDSALTLVIDSTAVGSVSEDTPATNPSGAIPTAGQTVVIDYIYTASLNSTLSHSFFAFSPYDDDFFQLAGTVVYVSGYKYRLTLYQKIPGRGYNKIDDYDYSLIRENNSFNQSLYITDVFRDNPYVKPFLNSNYTGSIAEPSSTTTIVDFTGGSKGDTPITTNYNSSWDNFKYPSKYKGKVLMDVQSGYASKLEEIIQNYQPHAFGITIVPPGSTAANAITYRSGLGIDYDNIALYTNWATISDPYNNSTAFVSQIGKIGAKFAQMIDVFDGLPPAGIDENNHGGQLAGFQVLEMEYDYDDDQQRLLDESQINPILFDPVYGPLISGNRTLQVTESDTSFIHTRRLYNLILENVVNKVLRRQVFKLNDDIHRLQAASLTEELLNPILGQGLLNSATIICDETNNTKAILNQRRFILDIYVQAAVSSERVKLRLTRLSQTAVLAEILPQ
jgi:hypothetical protein